MKFLLIYVTVLLFVATEAVPQKLVVGTTKKPDVEVPVKGNVVEVTTQKNVLQKVTNVPQKQEVTPVLTVTKPPTILVGQITHNIPEKKVSRTLRQVVVKDDVKKPEVDRTKVPEMPKDDNKVPRKMQPVVVKDDVKKPDADRTKVPEMPNTHSTKNEHITGRKMRAVAETPKITDPKKQTSPVIPKVKSPESPKVPKTRARRALKQNPCDLECTKFDFNPVCATNGHCLHEFANQCVMDVHNCEHPNVTFTTTNDEQCRMHWLKRCTPEELIH